MDLGRRHRRGARGGCLVQLDLLPLGARRLELPVGSPAKRDAALASKAELGPLARPGALPAIPPRASSGDLAPLVGLWLRHDGRSWRPDPGRGELVIEAWATCHSRSHF